jgi:hypothetical protein
VGVLTGLVCATESEIRAIDPDELLSGTLPGLEIKGTGLVELGTLLAIIEGDRFDVSLQQFPDVVGQESEQGPWVFGFSETLLRHLASASPGELQRLADAWVKTEEMEGWTQPEVLSRLTEIASFAQDSLQAGKPVHLWVAL